MAVLLQSRDGHSTCAPMQMCRLLWLPTSIGHYGRTWTEQFNCVCDKGALHQELPLGYRL
jgi:hypothetical protein